MKMVSFQSEVENKLRLRTVFLIFTLLFLVGVVVVIASPFLWVTSGNTSIEAVGTTFGAIIFGTLIAAVGSFGLFGSFLYWAFRARKR